MHFIRHFRTITNHKILVMKYCFRVGLYRQGLLHDLSKYTPSEFLPGARYYQGNRSPNNAEREETGLSKAWLHHKGRNKHHFEYWIDYSPGTGVLSGMEMPKRYVAEMFLDRVAASKVYKKETYTDADPLNYYTASAHILVIHPKARALLVTLLTKLSEEGEEAAFTYVKKVVLGRKRP